MVNLLYGISVGLMVVAVLMVIPTVKVFKEMIEERKEDKEMKLGKLTNEVTSYE